MSRQPSRTRGGGYLLKINLNKHLKKAKLGNLRPEADCVDVEHTPTLAGTNLHKNLRSRYRRGWRETVCLFLVF